MSKSSKPFNRHSAGGRLHGTGVIREDEHDPYRGQRKLADGTQCPQCAAVIRHGAWKWQEVPPDTPSSASRAGVIPLEPPPHQAVLCPACQRIKGHDAAGVLIIDSGLIGDEHATIRSILSRVTEGEAREHPLERILKLDESQPDGWVVETTGLHLVKRLGHSLAKAMGAQLHTRYLEGQSKAVLQVRRRPDRQPA